MKKYIAIIGFLFVSSYAFAGGTSMPSPIVVPTSSIISSATVAVDGGVTVIVSSPTSGVGPYSTGYYNYITNIHIEMYAAGTLTGGATPNTCTTTNLPNNPTFKFPTASATGTTVVTDMQFANPLQANQASQVTIVCPLATNVMWNVIVGYYQAS